MEKRIVVFALDDDQEDLYLLRRMLEDIPNRTVEFYPFTHWEACMDEMIRRPLDVFFVDYQLGALTGLEIVSALRKSGEKRPVIALTGKGDEKIAARITRAGADDYLVKDELTADSLRRTMDNAMERFKAQEEKAVLEKQLQESQKMETLETLVGGIAHDFNNLLMSIMGYAEFAKMKSREREVEDDLDNILATSHQMSELVRQLLSFSRKEEDKIDQINLGGVISDSVNILRHTLPKQTALMVQNSQESVWARANGALLNQVVLNLCLNASEAMPSGGSIIITYDYLEVDKTYLISHPKLTPGKNAFIEIKDTGHGMPPETLERIFEPFFTTKHLDSQKGTGLGLSIVWNNMKKMKGVVDVASDVEKGTVFRLYFPSGEAKVQTCRPTDVKNMIGEGEGVLVVDDEELVLRLIRKMLLRLKYKAYFASDCTTALDILREMKDEIKLVILDMSMPDTSGKECLKGLLALKPDVKVLFSSGHDLSKGSKELKALGASGLIQKPYALADLGERIKNVLDEN